MEKAKTWATRLSVVVVAAGALLSRDACLGGARPPPPIEPTATAVATANPAPKPPQAVATDAPATTAAPQ
ncbi:MAG: hypothetical protein IPK82_12140 [Polyangiaceae bacterium]|nr:hypothetical protein [Polyangiaceae bacterium]